MKNNNIHIKREVQIRYIKTLCLAYAIGGAGAVFMLLGIKAAFALIFIGVIVGLIAIITRAVSYHEDD